VSAVTRAPQSFALRMLDEHMATCASNAVAEGGEERERKLEEAFDAIARLSVPDGSPGEGGSQWLPAAAPWVRTPLVVRGLPPGTSYGRYAGFPKRAGARLPARGLSWAPRAPRVVRVR
jgi:hypothetical protein